MVDRLRPPMAVGKDIDESTELIKILSTIVDKLGRS